MNKALLVAKREFWVVIRKKGYIILTFGMPFFLLAYIGIVSIPSILIAKKEKAKKVVGIVDLAQVVKFELTEQAKKESIEGKEIVEKVMAEKFGQPQQLQSQNKMIADLLAEVEPVRFDTAQDAEQALKNKKISMYYVIPVDYIENGKVLSYSSGGSIFSSKGKEGFLKKLLIMSLLSGRLEPKIQERIQKPFDLDEYTLEEGKFVKKDIFKEIGAFGIPLAFCMILLMSIMMSSGYLIQGVAEEKENRVIEVILSSIKPDDLLLGKLLGLGGAGLLQLFVWLSLGSIPVLVMFTALDLKVSTLLIAFPYYVLGFLLIGSLMAGTGSLGSNFRESQQLTMMWTLPTVIPMIFFVALVDEPNGILARVFSYIPITTPLTMIIRIATGKTPWWEIPLTIFILIFAIYFSIKIFGKVFRIGILMYGKRPGIREIFRAAKQA